MTILSDENRYKLLKLLSTNSGFNQRQLAEELGVSLGKANYCLKALIEKGWVKASSFRHCENKKAYAYLLTPKGMQEKTRVTLRFLKYKQYEYESIQKELEALRQEVAQLELGSAEDR